MMKPIPKVWGRLVQATRFAWVNIIYLNAKDKRHIPQRGPQKVYLGNGIQYLKCRDHSDDSIVGTEGSWRILKKDQD